ncbi:MAG: chaperone modulator CbpM [Kangiellaceae bacterium]|jgi:chaperone modulatory protein CbpM|nr:chaperone modulator CbpM [Kangiellaceae bacterium]
MSETLFSISFEELCQTEGVEGELIIEIVEYGIVMPLDKNTDPTRYQQWLFDTGAVPWIKKALRLRQDLEIDWVAIAIVIELMQQKEALQKENESYQRQLKRFIKNETDN